MNWRRLAQAVRWYEHRGYQYMDVPWTVSPSASAVTKPEGGTDLIVQPTTGNGSWGVLVASAEQAFIQLMQMRALADGKYVTCTPCWRKEAVYTAGTRPCFMKVELIHVGTTSSADVQAVLTDARDFFQHFVSPTLVPTGDGTWDLEVNGVEVGSYGAREHGDLRWVYGTGLAEPRFEYALGLGA